MVTDLMPFAANPATVLELPTAVLAERDRWCTWDLVEGIVDLLIDWNLLTVEISLDELREWLDVPRALCTAALDQLAGFAGVHVAKGDPARSLVTIRIDADVCPLTAAPVSA